jgi:glycine betaine/choline ABC-type transport system substrate-binding protein
VLKQLGGILTVDEMRKLNYAVDGEKRQAKDVVGDFLKQKGWVLNPGSDPQNRPAQ